MGRPRIEKNEVSDEMAELLSKFKENTIPLNNREEKKEQDEISQNQ